MRRDPEGAAFALVTAVAVALAALGIALLPLLTSPVVRAVADDRGLAERTRLPRERALEAAEMARVYVTTPSPRRLPLALYGRDAFDERASDHLDDVRGVIFGGLEATLAACLAFAAALLLGWWRGRLRDVGAGMRAGGIALAAAVVVFAVFAVVAFDAAFTAFHAVFFEAGSWIFEPGDLMTKLFPEPFWAIMGAAWAVLATALAMVAAWAGSRLRKAAPAGRGVNVGGYV